MKAAVHVLQCLSAPLVTQPMYKMIPGAKTIFLDPPWSIPPPAPPPWLGHCPGTAPPPGHHCRLHSHCWPVPAASPPWYGFHGAPSSHYSISVRPCATPSKHHPLQTIPAYLRSAPTWCCWLSLPLPFSLIVAVPGQHTTLPLWQQRSSHEQCQGRVSVRCRAMMMPVLRVLWWAPSSSKQSAAGSILSLKIFH